MEQPSTIADAVAKRAKGHLPRPRSGILALPAPDSDGSGIDMHIGGIGTAGQRAAGTDEATIAGGGAIAGAAGGVIVPAGQLVVGGPYRFRMPQKPWPRPRTVYVQPSPAEELVGARRPFLAQPLVAARLSSSLLDVAGLQAAMAACLRAGGGTDRVMDTVGKANIECLK